MDHSNTNDERLMLAYAGGDVAAFDVLYQKHKGALYRYVVRQVSDLELAHDLYQECWSRIIKAADSYTQDAKWTTWAYRIAHNLVVDHYRAFKPLEGEVELESALYSPARVYDQQALAKQLSHCMSKLPAVQREVFILSQETDLTLQMVSQVVASSHESVKTRLRYARSGLKACLAKFGLYSSKGISDSGRHS
jgi:RNA polymerase sigma-70 factor (ECF subfamily)